MLKNFELAAKRYEDIKTASLEKDAFLPLIGRLAMSLGSKIVRAPIKSALTGLSAAMTAQEISGGAKNVSRSTFKPPQNFNVTPG